MDQNNSCATVVPNDTIRFLQVTDEHNNDEGNGRQAMDNEELDAVIDAQYEHRLGLDDGLPPHHASAHLTSAAITNAATTATATATAAVTATTASTINDNGLLHLLEPSVFADPYYYPQCDDSPSPIASYQNSGDGATGYAEAGPSIVSGARTTIGREPELAQQQQQQQQQHFFSSFHDALITAATAVVIPSSMDANSGVASEEDAWVLEQPQHRQQQEITLPSTTGMVVTVAPVTGSTAAAAAAAAATTTTTTTTTTTSNTATLNAHVALIEEFFIKNGAHRPPIPCHYCRRLRLQCLILQTTSANPNPIEACSSCVALYRDCSLAERSKRKAQSYETALPVIGHLHGVAEEGVDGDGDVDVDVDVDYDEERGIHAGIFDGGSNNNIDSQTLLLDDNYQQHQHRQKHRQNNAATVASTSVSASAGPAASTLSYKRNSTRSVKKTRVLRHWFATHYEHPYPTEEEKTSLADQCGLSKTQVINWFANARRRQRLTAQSHLNASSKIFHQGSPMPPSVLTGMSPMERWRHSPPDEEPVSASDIEQALSASLGLDGAANGASNSASSSRYYYSHNNNNPDKGYTSDGAPSSGSGDSGFFNPSIPLDAASSNSASSSAFSFYHSDDGGAARGGGGGGIFSLSAHSSIHGGDQDPGPSKASPSSSNRTNKNHIFQCTFCLQSFKKKYDWVRHERSIHLPGLDSWICTVPLPENQPYLVWRMDQSHPECIFCGQSSPTDAHIQSHEFAACAERPAPEKTFTRKDHLWQHLQKFHRCRKWEGWKPNLSLLQRRQDTLESRCGFCRRTMTTWEERAEHLAAHFRRGATMAGWTGGSGIKGRRDEGGTTIAAATAATTTTTSKQRLSLQGSGDVGKCLELFSQEGGEDWP